MKLKTILLFIALVGIVITSCNNDLKILAPYKNITVVYGLLDQNDPVHYIRINKAFEGNGNAYTMAQQYDSIYYPAGVINAVLLDSSPTTNTIVHTYTLDTTTSIPLNPGTFSYPKQLLYFTNATFTQGDFYNLVITNTKTGQKLTGTTPLLSDIGFTNGFATSKTLYLSFFNQNPTQIAWTTTPNARIYQMTIRFYYDEIYMGVVTAKSLDWIFGAVTSGTLSGGDNLSYSITAQGLYAQIASSMSPEAGVTRAADSVAIIFTSGSDDLNTYVQLSQPPLGINQDVPSFTDVKNGIGLYTSRHVQTLIKQLSIPNLDSLAEGYQTGNLGFAP